jgi:DNA primase
MSQIPDEVIERVRDAADLVEVIGEHVELKRTGSDYRGPCPFHGGKHRNFAVIPKKQMFYCFVCHEAGDVFTFYMKKLGLDYPSAVREVARRCGVTIPERTTSGPDPREPLFSAVAVAGEWYARRLREADDADAARQYLRNRAYDLEALLPHGIGFAPRGEAFLEAMAALGIAVEVLLRAGLAVQRDDGTVRPRFWNRVVFPIHDLRGRVVGFGGRIVGEGEPKYLNSSDTEIFHKGSLLYNLHQAKHAMRKVSRAVVVEGYFDVLRLVEVGIEETVAPLGTAFTVEQSRLLRRYTQDVTLLYDSDAAGLRASFRAADILLHAGLRVSIATPPQGSDPDSLAAEGGAKAVGVVLDDALDVLERKLQLLERRGWLGSLSGRRRALDRLLPTLRAVSDGVTRDLYLGRCAEALGISQTALVNEVEGGRWSAPPAAGEQRARAETPGPEARGFRSHPERDLLRVMLHNPSWRTRIAEHVAHLPTRDTVEWRLVRTVSETAADVSGGALLELVEAEGRAILARLVSEPFGGLDEDATVDGALRKIESRTLEDQLRAIDRKIPVASDAEKMALTREKEDLSRRISILNPARWNVIRKGRSGSAR